MTFTVKYLKGQWWILGDEEFGPIGPYGTKAEAKEDVQGLQRFYRHEDKKGYVTIDDYKTKERQTADPALKALAEAPSEAGRQPDRVNPRFMKGAKMTKAKRQSRKPVAKSKPQESVGTQLCLCGCGEKLISGKSFRQGHDARFHGRVRKLKDGRLSFEELKKLVKPYALSGYQKAVGKKASTWSMA